MDYPKSVPSVGLVNGKFVDENPATGMPGSLIPASWGNAVTEEVLNVIRSSGATPDETRTDQLWQSLRQLGVGQRLPVSALPNAVVQTADGRLPVTPLAASGSAGRVSIPAGVPIALGESFGDGTQGRGGAFVTSAWSSADLVANSTYFLRAQVVAGALSVYVQQGTLYDATPALLKGDVRSASGGGYPSTALDVCLAWIRTGAVGSVPSVVTTYNRKSLLWTQTLNGTGVIYLPIDPLARGARLHAANPIPHPTQVTSLYFPALGWQGYNYSYLNPTLANTISNFDGWKSPNAVGFYVFTNNLVGDVTISNVNVSFDHGVGRSLWNCYQAEHLYGATDAVSDELLFSMAIKGHVAEEYQSGIALNFFNAVNLQLAWELIR
ncbi:phage tail protein [Pseudomonas entomophila]|uniref:phage tail protein n=1 Tax=Pseudomonas entomophila TaxID=312306 RepID=UPI0023D844A1|nr:phage tail protein [Pseudomonas entomophila]MDF0730572.1 phage tail protein [Pseudomonas entomophila]